MQCDVSVKRLSNGLSYLANPTAFTASFSSENIAALARGMSAAGEAGLTRGKGEVAADSVA